MGESIVLGLVDHYSKGNTLAVSGLMGVKSGATGKNAWYKDIQAGVERLVGLKRAFDGDERRAAAAMIHTEAIVRSAGDSYEHLLPAVLR